MVKDSDDVALHEALASSQRLGMLGDRPVDEVIAHARAFVRALDDRRGTVLDLGSGGGVPGLVIAWDRPDLDVVLVDRRRKRTDHLERLVRRLGLEDRVSVLAGDAESLTREETGPVDAVVARGFGPPGTTLRVAWGRCDPDGVVVISEPPSGDRWSSALLDELGLRADLVTTEAGNVRRFVRSDPASPPDR